MKIHECEKASFQIFSLILNVAFFGAKRAKLLYYTLTFSYRVLLLNGWINLHEIWYGYSNHLWEGIFLKWYKSDKRVLPYGPLKLPCYFNRRNILLDLCVDYTAVIKTILIADRYYQLLVNTEASYAVVVLFLSPLRWYL